MSNNQLPASQRNPIIEVDNEISLLDILSFLKSAWRIVIIAGILGVIMAITYLAMTPKQYEARVQIAMAQIGISNNNPNSLGTNVEEPLLLIARLSSPTSFTSEEIAACGFKDKPDGFAALAKAIKLVPARGIPNLVDLKTFGASPEAAKGCAHAIFDLIKKTQAQIVAPYIEEAAIKLADSEERLKKARDLVARSDKGGSAMSAAAYLSTRDEIRNLLDEMNGLRNILISNQNRATRLVAPIYANEFPISPKKRIVLSVGLFGGFFLGLLIALSRQIMVKVKS